jgi:hypothetical protein
MDGICTLANDHVFDQVIALLNSIEAIMGPDFPVCIYPYDDQTDRLAAAIQNRPQVQIYSDPASIDYWDHQVQQLWDTHPTAKVRWAALTSDPYYRMGTHRRLCAFDGPFDRFVYMDADTLLLDDISPILAKLEQFDWVVYDFQHFDVSHVYVETSAQLAATFSSERIENEIFCSGFYAAKRGTFSQERLATLLGYLQAGEAEMLYCLAPDQTVLNYWVMRSGLSVYNFARALSPADRTGCCVTSDHFEARDQLLYDRGNRLLYLHYIGLSSRLFRQICAGENIGFPYRDLFLHYRYLSEPAHRPALVGPAQPYDQSPSWAGRTFRRAVQRAKIIHANCF